MTVTDNNNRIRYDIPPDDGAAIDSHTSSLEVLLAKYGADLGTEDVRSFAVAGDKSALYVKDALDVAQTVAGVCPAHVDTEEFARDVAGGDYYDAMERRLLALAKLMHDASILCRKDSYQQANAVYDGCKRAAEFNVPGAKAAADRLGRNFAGRGGGRPKSARKPPAGDDGASS